MLALPATETSVNFMTHTIEQKIPDSTPRLTLEEWHAEGTRRFGKCIDDWKFVCPICHNVASIGDFRQYKDKGATPDSATCQCIGRFAPKATGIAFPVKGEKLSAPCNYALFGLFRFPGVIVVKPDGEERMSFAFAGEEKTDGRANNQHAEDSGGGADSSKGV